MATREIDIIKRRSKELPPRQKIELIEFLTKSLSNGPKRSKQLEFGKYSSRTKKMSTAEDFLVAEWHPYDVDLNGN